MSKDELDERALKLANRVIEICKSSSDKIKENLVKNTIENYLENNDLNDDDYNYVLLKTAVYLAVISCRCSKC